jgi:hypothetical protein
MIGMKFDQARHDHVAGGILTTRGSAPLTNLSDTAIGKGDPAALDHAVGQNDPGIADNCFGPGRGHVKVLSSSG